MSIILEGIDIPKEGDHIVAVIKSNGKCSCWKQDTEYGICESMQTVEAIQIPTPHGRLIDEQKVLLTNLEIFMCDGSYKDALKLICEKLDNAPTILEAEE